MITSTSLKHPTIQMKIHAAMFTAMRTSKQRGGFSVAYPLNSKGNPIMRVMHSRNEAGAFEFYKGNKNITKLVIDSLRENN